ncbi:hypothetical protein PMAYCL1PPCAC_10830 [Pristionchus mayeri]|uniref:Uncharacterized protein n=1 Tax=Pristionchus mayeri TaxID=1317129 RepID=A0AAN4ZP95_9BILA|nr:hypothetical protein PMAYCL1PPCAC_10830 [Pristionchus mayeri]
MASGSRLLGKKRWTRSTTAVDRAYLRSSTRKKHVPQGYDCGEEWPLTTNGLSMLRGYLRRQCEVGCAPRNRHFQGESPPPPPSVSSSEWTTKGEKLVDPVVCAKFCDKGVCCGGNSRANSKDFRPLKVTRADDENSCALKICNFEEGMVIINDNGTPFGPLKDVAKVTCTGDGDWKAEDNERYKYVM